MHAAAVEREHEREPPDEVRRDDAHQHAALVMRLANEAEVPELEVAQPAVDQLRGGARRGAAEVAAIDERDSEPDPRRGRGDAGADDPAADDEHVEALGGEPLAGVEA